MTAIDDARTVQVRTDSYGREAWTISLTTGIYTDTMRMTEVEARLVHRALGERLTAPPTDAEREALAKTVYYWDVSEDVGSKAWEQLTEGMRDVWREAADAILAAGFRRQGPTTGGWEYGIRPEDDDVPLGVSPMPTLDAARTRANNIRGGWIIVRRRKAGPWEPVEAARDAS